MDKSDDMGESKHSLDFFFFEFLFQLKIYEKVLRTKEYDSRNKCVNEALILDDQIYCLNFIYSIW